MRLLIPLCAGLLFLSGGAVVSAQDAQRWNEYKAEHFIIYYRNVPADFLRSVEKSSEGYYQEITENLGFRRSQGWSWENRAKIYIYKDADDYIANSNQQQWSHGAASAKQRTIRTFPAAHGFFDSVLPHELGHIIFREFIGNEAEVPLWFEEGVAMYQEKARRWGSHGDVKMAMKNGQFISLSDLTNMRLYSDSPKAAVDLFYAESASIVNYMITDLGESRFVRLCRQLKEGVPFEEAMQSVYVRFHDFNDLNKSWLNYLEQLK